MATPGPIQLDENFYHATLGALFIGFSCSCAVFGVLTQQMITYYQRYFHDKIVYKLVVALLWIMELTDLIFIGYAVYLYTIIHYGDFAYLMTQDVHWTLIIQVLLATVVGLVVKSAFAIRVWTFSKKNIWITGLISVMIMGQTGLALAYCVKAFQVRKLEHASQLKTIATLSLSAGVLTDLVIAASLCYFLRKLKTGFKKSDSLVNMLSIYAINTGALTSAVSGTTLILYNMFPEYLYFMGSYFVLGNLYAISFICTLNTRRVLRGVGTDNNNSTTENSQRGAIFMMSPTSATRPNFPHNSARDSHMASKQGVEIGIRREITVLTDLEAGEVDREEQTPSSYTASPIKTTFNFR